VRATSVSIIGAPTDVGASVRGANMGPEALRVAVAAAIAKDPKSQAIIAGDKAVSHGRVVWVLDLVKSLGVTSFAIQIDPAEMVSPGGT